MADSELQPSADGIDIQRLSNSLRYRQPVCEESSTINSTYDLFAAGDLAHSFREEDRDKIFPSSHLPGGARTQISSLAKPNPVRP